MDKEDLLKRVINYQLSLRNLTEDDAEIMGYYDLDSLKIICNVYAKEGMQPLFRIEITYDGRVDLMSYEQPKKIIGFGDQILE